MAKPKYVKVRTHVRTAPGYKGKSKLNAKRTKFRNKLPKGVALKRQSKKARQRANQSALEQVIGAVAYGGDLSDLNEAELGMFKGKKMTKRDARRLGGYVRQARARRLTPYQKFVAKHRKQGKSMKQIGAMWRSR